MDNEVCLFDYIQEQQNNGNIPKPIYDDKIEIWRDKNGAKININELPYNKVRSELHILGIKPISSTSGSSFGEIYSRSSVDQVITNLGLW